MTALPNAIDPYALARFQAQLQMRQQEIDRQSGEDQLELLMELLRQGQAAQGDAKQANESRYNDILELLGNTRGRILGDLEGYGQSLVNDTRRDYKNLLNNQLTALAERGLSASTARVPIENANKREADSAINRITDANILRRTGADERFIDKATGVMERRTDTYPNPSTITGAAGTLGGLIRSPIPAGSTGLPSRNPIGRQPRSRPAPQYGGSTGIGNYGPGSGGAQGPRTGAGAPTPVTAYGQTGGTRRVGLSGLGRRSIPMPQLPTPPRAPALSPQRAAAVAAFQQNSAEAANRANARRGAMAALKNAYETPGYGGQSDLRQAQQNAIQSGFGNWQTGVANGMPILIGGGGAGPMQQMLQEEADRPPNNNMPVLYGGRNYPYAESQRRARENAIRARRQMKRINPLIGGLSVLPLPYGGMTTNVTYGDPQYGVAYGG